MKATGIILTLLALATMHAASAQKISGFNTATAIGRMSVTLLTPAALSSTRSLSFRNVSLPTHSDRVIADNEETGMQTASVKVFGNNMSYNVSIPDLLVFNSANGRGITLEDIFVKSESGFNGSGTLHIGAKMRIYKEKVNNNESNSPMAVTINFN